MNKLLNFGSDLDWIWITCKTCLRGGMHCPSASSYCYYFIIMIITIIIIIIIIATTTATTTTANECYQSAMQFRKIQ